MLLDQHAHWQLLKATEEQYVSFSRHNNKLDNRAGVNVRFAQKQIPLRNIRLGTAWLQF